MRRRSTALATALVLAAPLSLSACSGSDDVGVSVKGAFGARPDVSIPKDAPADGFAVKTLGKGKGEQVRKGDLVIADYVGFRWNKGGNKLLASSYVAGQPGAFPTGRLVPGLEKALKGARAGGRVVARIPPKDGYGTKGSTQHQVGADDTLVYVLDVRAIYPKTAAARGKDQPLDDPALPKVGPAGPGQPPPVTVPKVAAPKRVALRVLTQGDGPPVRKDQVLALQYEGLFWRDGKVFDSSWKSGRPSAVTIGTGQVMKGWDQTLVGQKVGSRVLLVVPPAFGYGAKGLPQAGIKGDDTLVFVVDILGAH
ncbi:FKBP-type peptidyl-prolyl cis-trans isomerase [Spirillospora sp. CA-294931]|uniref:FKBP-type peptidyl-prolyl cis-trans isomerase n=1 Tax=Spirillospora sp. CA-294931 TaxID=3240042 RepID=UPI003D94F537